MHAPFIAARPPRKVTIAWTMALVIVVAACSSPAASQTGGDGGTGGVGTITISGNAFSPASVTVASGDPINFKNNDASDHRIVVGENGTEVASPAFEAITLGSTDQTHDIRLSPGNFKVTCTIHPSMNMTVTVTG